MGRLVNTIALGAAMIALALAVWRDYGAAMALKQTLMIYLAVYFVAGGLGLATRAALTAVRDPEPEPDPEAEITRGKSRRKRRPAPVRSNAAPVAAETPTNAPSDESAAPEPAHAG